MRLCKIIAIQWRNCANNRHNSLFKAMYNIHQTKYCTRLWYFVFCYVPYKICKMDFEDPSYTAPSGLILPGLGILDRHTSLADRCLPGLPEGIPLRTPLNKLGNQDSLAWSEGQTSRFPLDTPLSIYATETLTLLIWQPFFPPRTKSNQGFFPAYARIFSFF